MTLKKVVSILLKLLLAGITAIVVVLLLSYLSLRGFVAWKYHLPDAQVVQHQFQAHRADFLRLVGVLNADPSITQVEKDGSLNGTAKSNPELKTLLAAIGAQFVTVREDRSMEFTLYGWGGTIMDDSYLGVRYVPPDYKINPRAGWEQTVVSSLDPKRLPQENGGVATGLYALPIEPSWFIYRFEYQE